MKATLEFTLPEEHEAFQLATRGTTYSALVSDLDRYLRDKIKYAEMTGVECAVYQQVRDKLYQLAEEYEVTV